MKRRILSIITALALCLSLCPAGALAAGDGTAENPWECGNDVTAVLDNGTLTISGTGTMKDWSSIEEAPWKNSDITEVTIEAGVTSIGEYAFYGCAALAEISIPNGVTSIGSNAFNGCNALAEISIPESIKSIGVSAFQNCAALRQITIPGNIDVIDYGTFGSCTALESVTINGSVTGPIRSAFSGCTALKSLTINGSVGDIVGGAFFGSGINRIEIHGDVGDIEGSAFSNSGINKIEIHGDVGDIVGGAFSNCTALKSLTITGNATGVNKSIGSGAFSGCNSLETFTIPSGITSIGGGAFSGCSGLTSVTIPESVTSIEGSAFSGCSGLTSVTYPAGLISSLNANIPENAAQYVYGDLTGTVTLASARAITVAEGKTLTIPSGATLALADSTAQLINSGTILNNGTIQIAAGGSLSGTGTLSGSGTFTTENLTNDMISVPTDLFYNGEDRSDALTTALTEALSNVKVPICGKDFTVSGWTLAVAKTDDLHYTATYTNNNDSAKTFTKTITLQKSGTDLADGKVKTYKDETETTSFTAGDTIKVVAKPTPTEAAPTNSAMFAASFTTPGAGQMAVFVGDAQVSEPVGAVDGTYTMEVSADDVLAAAGGPGNVKLTARFVESASMAGAASEVDITISAVAKIEKDSVTAYVDKNGLINAFTNNNNAGATFTLLDDVELTNTLTIGINCTLDLAEYTIRYNQHNQPFAAAIALINSTVTIRGEGGVTNTNGAALRIDGTHATLEGGTFCGGGTYGTAVILAGNSLSIPSGAAVRLEGSNIGLNVGSGTVKLSAGTYSGGTAAINISAAGKPLADLLAEGCAYHSGDTPIPLQPDGKELTGTVTVKACNHTGEGVCTGTHIEDTFTHTKTCLACGETWAAEDCAYTFSGATGTCAACGDSLTVAVSGTEDLVYDGTGKKPGVTVMWAGTELAAGAYTVAYTDNTNAGTAKVTVTIGNNQGTYNGSFTIDKATPTITWSSTSQELTYTGSAAAITAPTVTLVNNEQFTGTINYSYTGTTSGTGLPTNAGTYTIRAHVDAAGNYTAADSGEMTLTIDKAQATVTTTPAANTLTYTGAAQALVTAGTASIGDVVYSLTETGTYSTTIPTGTNAGSYTVWYKVEGTTNYEGTAPVKVDVTISKVIYTGEKAGATSGKFGMTKTYNLTDLLPEGYVLGTPTVTDSDNIFNGAPSVSGTELRYTLADVAGNLNKTGEITVPVTSSTNYNPFTLTITVTVTDKIVPTLTANPISVTYTGSAVPNSAIRGTATADGRTIPGSWSFADGQALTDVADSGTKTVIFTPADEVKDDYATATETVRVTISKATPGLTLTPFQATLLGGGTVTLTLSGLPAGNSADVTCSDAGITVTRRSGDTWTAELPAGGASYTFTASYSGDGNHSSASARCTVSVGKITPTLSLTANPASLRGSGTVTLTLSGLPAGGTAAVTCSGGITVTAATGSTWTATLPNSAATYTFTASYAGNASYNAASASCTVETTEVTVLPNPPEAGDGKQYQVVMEDGISEVPAGLQSIETLNTPRKLETAMKTAITQANSGVPQDNTAVYDVELQISTDGGATWVKATAGNFPTSGLTVTLPYPAGTNSSYIFTVVHMFTTSDFGKTPGDTETPRVTNTASGLQFTVSGLSPISVGWVQPSTPTTPTGPTGGGGGGGSSSAYAVTVERAEHGKVTSNRTNASSGSTVTLTVTPDTGYVLDTLTVTDGRGSEIRLTAQGGGKYTFTMPSRAVTVKATFAPLPDDRSKPCDGGANCPSHGFTDLGAVGTWYHEAVDYVLQNNLMGGYGNGMFGPNDTLTRAQFAQILYNKEGRPAVTGGSSFTDVAPGVWCAPAITWAAERGIVGGYGNGMFGPNDNITREQLAVMLWRYAGSPAATDKELHFTDTDKASGYALEALRWAVENGIVNGYGNGQLGPQGLASRAQVAQMLKNFIENQESK